MSTPEPASVAAAKERVDRARGAYNAACNSINGLHAEYSAALDAQASVLSEAIKAEQQAAPAAPRYFVEPIPGVAQHNPREPFFTHRVRDGMAVVCHASEARCNEVLALLNAREPAPSHRDRAVLAAMFGSPEGVESEADAAPDKRTAYCWGWSAAATHAARNLGNEASSNPDPVPLLEKGRQARTRAAAEAVAAQVVTAAHMPRNPIRSEIRSAELAITDALVALMEARKP